MVLFNFAQFDDLGRYLAQKGLTQSHFSVERYKNNELHILIKDQVASRRCAVLGSIAPPDQQLMCFTLLAHTLKTNGATRVEAILPYLAYTREDKNKVGESMTTAWAGALIKASGIDNVLTVDLHSERDKRLFPVSLLSLSPAKLFAARILEMGWETATIVAPDNGALTRCEAVKSSLGVASRRIAYFEKRRGKDGVVLGELRGEVGRQAILIDDILDTGETLVSACEKLVQANVQEICIFVTHGLFTGSRWKQFRSLNVKRLFCTDAVPLPVNLPRGTATVLSIASLLHDNIFVPGGLKPLLRGLAAGG